MKWISVNDELPNCHRQHRNIFASDMVLTVDDSGEYDLDHFLEGGQHTARGWIKENSYWASGDNVTHWMPLPEPPKK